MAEVVGLVEEGQPGAEGFDDPGVDGHVEGSGFFAPLERRHHLISGGAADAVVPRQDVGDQLGETVGDICGPGVEPVAHLYQLQLTDEVVLMILGLEKRSDGDAFEVNGRRVTGFGSHGVTI